MDMQQAVRTVLGKYATFSGRAPRSEFWWWVLAIVLLQVALSLVDGFLIAPMLGQEPFAPEAAQPLSSIAGLALLLPSIAVSVRRLHDMDMSGWWYLLALIPLIGTLVLLYWYVQRGTVGANRFGEDPTPN
jgi:uncharacterized membrane protein YhaH (DUF805 family)